MIIPVQKYIYLAFISRLVFEMCWHSKCEPKVLVRMSFINDSNRIIHNIKLEVYVKWTAMLAIGRRMLGRNKSRDDKWLNSVVEKNSISGFRLLQAIGRRLNIIDQERKKNFWEVISSKLNDPFNWSELHLIHYPGHL